ncbi:MAG TPA: acetamidase/formamidase family protein [Natronosporangium sp.]|nr:acetamidase/formamidase family protein [Natronosporangium sp.]
MAVHEIRIDPARPLSKQPETGHNRWHPDIPPVVRCQSGDEVIFQTRDALDGQCTPLTTVDEVATMDLSVVHPLTGPIHVAGAEPSDVLEVEILEVVPDTYGFTVQIPGFGFLRDEFPDPYVVHWDLADGWATSAQLPGVRIPAAPFLGTIGLSPGVESLRRITRQERAALDAGGAVMMPLETNAVPSDPAIAATALRTIPPRQQGGNVDIKQLGAGTRLFLRVDTPGALFSAGDAHFAQGDGEVCGTAIETRATVRVRFTVHKEWTLTEPQFSRTDYWVAPQYAAPRRFHATTGRSVARDGTIRAEDVTLATRNALLQMIDHLQTRGWSRQQAYAICSVAVDLRVSQVVDVPHFLVTAFLPEDIFTG